MRTLMTLVLVAALAVPGLAKESVMVDRPGELLQLAEELMVNIQTAESIRDEIMGEIDARSMELVAVDNKLKNPNLSKGEKLDLQAEKNRLEMEENRYRRQALEVVKEQMDNVFGSLESMNRKLKDLKARETVVRPEVVDVFNNYFQVSAEIIRNSTRGVAGADPKALGMMKTLEKSLMVSQKSSDFLDKASVRIKEYQKVVALYIGKLSYLESGMVKHWNSLEHERDAITITATLETTEQFMSGLDMDKMEAAFMQGLSRNPNEYTTGMHWIETTPAASFDRNSWGRWQIWLEED